MEEIENQVVKPSTKLKFKLKKPALSVQSDSETKRTGTRFKWLAISLTFFIVLVMSVASAFWWYATTFEANAGQSIFPLIKDARSGLEIDVFRGKPRINFLILGLDEIQNQREGSMLTDTIVMASLSKNGKLHLLSLPRDLWIDSLKTKINALYYYGQESEQTTGVELVKTVVQDISGQTIDYTLVVKLNTLEEIVNALGGLNVDVPHSFTDHYFPREDVNIHAADASQLYETVEFTAGHQVLSGDQTLKYIRSRHSEDQREGNDLARTKRQQLVISALAKAVMSEDIVKDPAVLGRLYKVWDQELESNLTNQELVSIVKTLVGNEVTFHSANIPVQENGQEGIIWHPPQEKHDQWVYEPVDATWQQFATWVGDQIHEK